jgi:hypothetical protein
MPSNLQCSYRLGQISQWKTTAVMSETIRWKFKIIVPYIKSLRDEFECTIRHHDRSIDLKTYNTIHDEFNFAEKWSIAHIVKLKPPWLFANLQYLRNKISF